MTKWHWALICLATAGCRQAVDSPDENVAVVVRVGNRQVTLDEFMFFVERSYPELGTVTDPGLLSRMFDTFTRDLMIEAYATNVGLNVGDDEIEQFIGQQMTSMTFNLLDPVDQALWRSEIQRRLVIQQFLQREIVDRILVPEEDLVAYFEEHRDDFKHPLRYRFRHVQTDDQAVAEDFIAELKKTKEPFTKIAPQFSANDAYRLPAELAPGDLPEGFRVALSRLKPGQYSKVVPVDYGEITLYHVLYLESLIPEVEESFDDAYARIKGKLERLQSEERLRQLTDYMEQNVPLERLHGNLPFEYVVDKEDGENT